jgi:YHS domain-containing protein
MIKNLVLLAFIYLIYRMAKRWVLDQDKRDDGYPLGNRGDDKDDVMIKDPQCGVYFPQRSGVSLRVDGKTLYFCSEQCRDDYKKTV